MANYKTKLKIMRQLLIFFLIGISINVCGQIQYFGVHGGLNISNLAPHQSNFEDLKFKFGGIGGIQYEILFKDQYT